jgi:hypothetical protein
MSSIVARAAVAPVLAQAAVRAEQVTQLVLGETAVVLERTGEWLRVCTHADDYEGWVHSGYLIELEEQAVQEWRSAASAWSDGALIRTAGGQLHLPLRARVVLENDRVRLPDGKRGRVVSGCVREMDQVMAGARAQAPERWALESFSGSPYLWGGVTPWGVDCSGLVQTTFAARGIAVPRDSAQQAGQGAPVPLDGIRPGDLLFFRGESSSRINHVAFAGESDTLVHATLACGGTLVESWGPGTRAAGLRERLVAARRLQER